VEKRRFVLFHFPIAEWDQYFRNSIHLYGHVHNSAASGKRLAFLENDFAFNAGVDVNCFFPVSIYDIIARTKAKKHEEFL
jgi:calcineurin-like phosphoesterase family protein